MPYKDPEARAECKRRWAEANPEKVRAAQKRHYAANKDEKADYQRKYRSANRQKVYEWHAVYYKENKERISERNKAWSQDNVGKANAKTARYYAAKMHRTPPWANRKKIERIYELAAWTSRITGEQFEVDHVIPLQGNNVSGLHVENNLQVIPRSENRVKNNRWTHGSIFG